MLGRLGTAFPKLFRHWERRFQERSSPLVIRYTWCTKSTQFALKFAYLRSKIGFLLAPFPTSQAPSLVVTPPSWAVLAHSVPRSSSRLRRSNSAPLLPLPSAITLSLTVWFTHFFFQETIPGENRKLNDFARQVRGDLGFIAESRTSRAALTTKHATHVRRARLEKGPRTTCGQNF